MTLYRTRRKTTEKNDEAGAVTDIYNKCFRKVFIETLRKAKLNWNSMVTVFFCFFTLPPILWEQIKEKGLRAEYVYSEVIYS